MTTSPNSTPITGSRRYGVAWNGGEAGTGAAYEHSRYERNCDAVRKVNELRAAGFVAELAFVGGYYGESAYGPPLRIDEGNSGIDVGDEYARRCHCCARTFASGDGFPISEYCVDCRADGCGGECEQCPEEVAPLGSRTAAGLAAAR